ncbi:sensor histidine kinase [Trichothermofontia sp.]
MDPLPPSVCITVTNTGVEIAPTELPHLFEKFYRIPNHDPWRQGGTGLGLPLIKGLIEKLDGTLRVESSHNQTCFSVCFGLTKPGEVTSGS